MKAVDEYHESHSDIYKDKSKKDELPSNMSDLPLFYKEPRKKVNLSSPADDLKVGYSCVFYLFQQIKFQSFLGSDESAEATLAPEPEENIFTRTAEPGNTWMQARKQSGRPHTVESLLSEELENLGIDEKKLNNFGSDQSLQRQILAEKHHSALFSSAIHNDAQNDGNLIEVGGYKERRGRASMLAQEHKIPFSRAPSGYNKKINRKISKAENLLKLEQDELTMSLSSAKFKSLKNANLERVKAEDRLFEDDEGKHFREISMSDNKKVPVMYGTDNTFRDMPNDIYDEMPSDTFREIPEDVFENIPRAVTARIQNREKRKPVPKDRNDIFEQKQDDFTASAPAIPLDENHNQEDNSTERDATSVGFIAMLFTGAPTRPGQMEQVESDFMFALFIQKQEEEAANRDGNPGQKQPQDSSVGHFCAPHLPGFCEANFCIFHTSGPPS